MIKIHCTKKNYSIEAFLILFFSSYTFTFLYFKNTKISWAIKIAETGIERNCDDHLMTPFWYRFFRSDRNVNTCCQYHFKFRISSASQCHLCVSTSHFLLVCEAHLKIWLLKHPIRWDLINKGALILEYFLLIFEFLKKIKKEHLNFKHLLYNGVRCPDVGAQKRGAGKIQHLL